MANPTLFMILREKARRQGVGCCEGALVGFGRRRAAGGVHLARISADPSAARGVTQTVRDDFRHTEAHCPPGLIKSLCDRGADRPLQAGQGGACGIARILSITRASTSRHGNPLAMCTQTRLAV